MSHRLMCVLLGAYLIILGASIIEKRYLLALYWVGAIIIQAAILLMRVK
jgi:uncharacterized membrane-anchored protein